MKILDYQDKEEQNLIRDKQIAQENHKLKYEIQNLAEAIDSIMKEDSSKHRRGVQDHEISPTEYAKVKNELKSAQRHIEEQSQHICHLESKQWQNEYSPTFRENRCTKVEINPYRNSPGRSSFKNHKDEVEGKIEELVHDMDELLNSIESSTFEFERKHNTFVSPTKSFGSNDNNNDWITSLREICSRLNRLKKVTEIIVTEARKSSDWEQENSFDSWKLAKSSISEKIRDGENLIERQAEKYLSIADQKYQNYFSISGVDRPDLKDCAFKDLYNLNHQIIKLLQKAEDRANMEALRAERNKKILKEIDEVFEILSMKHHRSFVFYIPHVKIKIWSLINYWLNNRLKFSFIV
jgi:hypothetical protein